MTDRDVRAQMASSAHEIRRLQAHLDSVWQDKDAREDAWAALQAATAQYDAGARDLRGVMRASDRQTRCYRCGGEATERQRLAPDPEYPSLRSHEAARPCADAFDSLGKWRGDKDGNPLCGHRECAPEWECPPMADGWARCGGCYLAQKVGTMMLAERAVMRDGKLGWRTVIEDDAQARPICADGCREWKRLLRDMQPARHVKDASDPAADGQASDERRADLVPADGDGVRIEDLMQLWGVSMRAARDILRRLLDSHLLVAQDLPHDGGGKAPKAYWRAP